MTIFVLEGPDFAGKSTLAQHLARALTTGGNSVVIRHTGQPDLERQVPLAQVYLDAVSNPPPVDHVIYDRLHVGELVYGPLFRGSSALSHAEMKALDSVLLARGARLIYVRPPNAILLQRFRGGRGDDLVKQEDQLMAAARAYDSLIGPDLKTPWQHISSDAPTDAKIAASVVRPPR